jgi:chitinase
MRRRWFAGASALILAAGAVVAIQTTSEAAVLPNGFKSVGYMPSWSGSANAIQYTKLTHINYAFVLPNGGSGALTGVPDPGKLQSIVSLAHANNVRVSIAIGGWNDGNDSGFEQLAGNAGARTTFVNNVVNMINQYNLDGVDIDWEYPDPGTSGNNFTALMSQLSTAMHSRGKLLTAAVVSEGGTANGVQPAVFGMVDWLNIMAYDGGSPHANYDWSIASANFWKGRGLPASKTVLGVPFYTRPSGTPYNQIPERTNPNIDCVSSGCYNGVTTVRRKTQWALQNAGGIMYWELSQDTSDNATSLVNAIYDVAVQGGGPTTPPTTPPGGRTGRITGIAGKCVDIAGASTVNGAAVQLFDCNGTGAQTWTVGNDGTVRALGKCLDIAGAGTANGTLVQSYDCNGTGAQVWQAQTNGTLRNPASGRCVDASNNSSANGTRLQIWDCGAGANQRWVLP